MGLLAGIFAHDFNNLLTTILGYTSLAYTQTPPNSPLHHQLREALTSGDRAKELVQHILKAHHDTQLPYVPLCLKTITHNALASLDLHVNASLTVRQHIETSSTQIRGNDWLLSLLVRNLCSNVVESMPSTGGTLEVVIQNVDISKEGPAHPHLDPGSYVKFQIRDNGPGIAPLILNRIFEPFFTTKSSQGHQGLGLAPAKDIVAKHEGSIFADSIEGQETTFTIYFPRLKSFKGLASEGRPSQHLTFSPQHVNDLQE